MLRPDRCLVVAGAVLASLALAVPHASAQVSFGGEPPSFSAEFPSAVPAVTLPAVDVAALLAEDAQAPKNTALRFGAVVPLGAGIDDDGVWDRTPDGASVWRLEIRSPGAFSLGLLFSRYVLPEGARLYVYGDDRESLLGAFTSWNNKDNGEFAIHPVPGDAITVEYVVPAGAPGFGELVIGEVVHDYQDLFRFVKQSQGQQKAAGACEVDVNCPQGAGWTAQKRATAMLINGGLLCSGSMLNNTAGDKTQLFITANHCGTLNNAVFRFNYERSGCGSGSAPTNQTVQGSVQLATSSGIDYRLVRITETIPAAYNVHLAGWNRSSTPTTNTTTIHHPQGDVKKISFDNHAPQISGTDWRIVQWDLGVTEPGSSGCPLYDANGRFIGQLWGGEAFCGFPFNDYYGRLDQAWSQVKAFLDPGNTNAVTTNGLDLAGGCGSSAPYGTACAGSGGFQPTLALSGCFTAGGNVTLSIGQGLGLSQAWLFVGPNAANIPIGAGCFLAVNPVAAMMGPIQLNGFFPGSGTAAVNATLPGNTPPGVVRMQAFIVDGGVPLGLSATRGVQMTIQ